ncbi:septum site-determining protein MinC [Methylomagnum ishizawai]|uniref:Probable septum site-determining protein MinC n=1 Tax=Methylomagnum ishizawai TaxID=1760988 RepID=A0A1Y6CY44_9GAMM|nr:septum site-determining protein MinC [Methylomagnum ishizawai]SMF93493.1 septum site-determining protein MinC [Methylomagnum ishizawai]
MAAKNSDPQQPSAALDIRAGAITLPILKLFTADLIAVNVQLEEKLRRAPEFFRYAPVVLDLAELDPDREKIDFPALLKLLRKLDLMPAGVRGGNPAQHSAAQAAQLAVLADGKETAAPAAPRPAAKSPEPPKSQPATKLVEQPVRSGQRVYAQGGDLIVRAQISAGAEIIADGNIHIYGRLKGRALAGVQGNPEARIFCADLQAELVGIGTQYKISENIDPALWGKPAHIHLVDNALVIDPL